MEDEYLSYFIKNLEKKCKSIYYIPYEVTFKITSDDEIELYNGRNCGLPLGSIRHNHSDRYPAWETILKEDIKLRRSQYNRIFIFSILLTKYGLNVFNIIENCWKNQ